MAEIILEFDLNGELKTEGKGFKGKTCDKAMKDFEDLGRVKSRKNKAEYYGTETQKTTT
jgi:hypothetical protein